MTVYNALRQGWFGEYTDTPADFKPNLEIDTQITLNNRADFTIDVNAVTTNVVINLGQITNGKFLVVQSSAPVNVYLGAAGTPIPCDPLLIVTNSALDGTLDYVEVEYISANATIEVRVRD